LASAAMVSVLLPLAAAMLAGLNVACMPAGRPLTDSLTAPLKPLVGVTVALVVMLLACTTETVDGTRASLNPGVGTLTVTLPLAMSAPPLELVEVPTRVTG